MVDCSAGTLVGAASADVAINSAAAAAGIIKRITWTPFEGWREVNDGSCFQTIGRDERLGKTFGYGFRKNFLRTRRAIPGWREFPPDSCRLWISGRSDSPHRGWRDAILSAVFHGPLQRPYR